MLTLDRPRILAILNITPDSFSDGGQLSTPDAARDAGVRAVEAGADMLDVGAESTRPGAARVAAAEQIRRLVPSLRALRAALPSVPMSIDTTLAAVARVALDEGADAVNDVSACLEDPEMLPLAAERRAGLILMHRLRPPGEDSYSDRYADVPQYTDVMGEVCAFLASRANAALGAGVERDAVVLDPGLGFGKSVEQNLVLLRETPRLVRLNYPILSALSRKSFVGRVGLDRESDPGERVAATVALSVAHYFAGARLFRVHDVRAHVEALRAISALRPPNMPQTD